MKNNLKRINILRLTDAEVAMIVEALAAEIGAAATRSLMQEVYQLARLSKKIQQQASQGRKQS